MDSTIISQDGISPADVLKMVRIDLKPARFIDLTSVNESCTTIEITRGIYDPVVTWIFTKAVTIRDEGDVARIFPPIGEINKKNGAFDDLEFGRGNWKYQETDKRCYSYSAPDVSLVKRVGG